MTSMVKGADAHWYAMRDLARRQAKIPVYQKLADLGFEVFTPMTQVVSMEKGRRVSRVVPYMRDLLFVRSAREQLDAAVAGIKSCQYRYATGGGYCEPMVVRDADMDRFICAVKNARSVRYFRPDEISPAMCGRRARVIGGVLDGYEGTLLAVRGSKYRRMLIALPSFLTAAVEIQPDLLEILE